ncbi:DUF3644 domain-containing protein [Streptomyces sp. NPDC000961]|uniref:DUF3644 domain-containing protein n=1 Tax=Streptomyces sp. NPDC000961 TaxID=3364541 RepID=UPI0036CC68F5
MPAGTTSSWGRSATPSRQLMIALRNKVERRYEHDLKIATGGKAQALVMNYEQEMVAFFGSKYSLADRLRFPISLQALTAEGRKQLQEAAKKLPKHTRDVVAKLEADIDQAVLDDYRVRLVPIVGSKTEADLAIDFVKLDELTEEERKVMVEAGRRGMVIIKDRHVEVADKDKPSSRHSPAGGAVEAATGYAGTAGLGGSTHGRGGVGAQRLRRHWR